MKRTAVILLVALAAVGLVAGAQAPAAAPADSSSARGSVSTPGGDVRGQVTNDRNSSSRPSEDGSALPRMAMTRSA